jgi:hypothetical protein
MLRFLTILALTLASGGVAGSLSHRWREPVDMSVVAEQLKLVPEQFGDWQSQGEEPLDDSLIKMLDCAGYIHRSYRNRVTGDTVHMAVVLGPHGPISVHTPEICYSNQGYHVETPAERWTHSSVHPLTTHHSPLTPPPAEFMFTRFAPDVPSQSRLVAYHAWSDGGAWAAPKHPRIAYGGKPYLFKFQAAALVQSRPGRETDPCRGFLQAWLAACAKARFPGVRE